MKSTVHYLETSKVTSHSNIIMGTVIRTVLSLGVKHNDTNEVSTYDTADGDGSDRPIAARGVQVDGDLFGVASWVGGFGLYRMENDGTITEEFHDYSPIGSGTYYQSIALDTANSIAYVGSYNNVGIARYDYSNVKAGGTTVNTLSVLTESDGLYGDEFGHAYTSGLAIVGDYLYYSTDDKSSPYQNRWKISTGTNEQLTIQNKRRDIRYGAMYYSAATDRMYNHSYYDAELVITTDASHATNAKSFYIRYDDLTSVDNDAYIHMVIEDNVNPNHLWMGSGYQTFKIDVTDCIVDGVTTGTLPTLLVAAKHREVDHKTFTNMRFMANSSQGSDYIYVLSDRGWNRQMGWLDQENHNVVSLTRYINSSLYKNSHDYLFYDYQVDPQLITTANNSKYWLFAGYGWDGYKFRTYNESDALFLYTSGYAEFGVYQMDDLGDIGTIQIAGSDEYFYAPTNTTISVQVSNNNGSTWENYTLGTEHLFSSTGNQAKVKINITGNGNKCGYVLNDAGMIPIVLGTDYDYDTPVRYVKTSLKGGY